jgi:hypothetical protein
MIDTYLYISLGVIIGYLYFNKFEKFNTASLPEECYYTMHYLFKLNSPLYIVHAKSIFAGALIILSTIYKYDKISITIGSAIIGLHIAQFINEKKIIGNKKLIGFKK